MKTKLQAEDLSFHYTDEEGKAASHEIFAHLNLTIEPGTFVAILGHNGCGKSTLAKHMNAIVLPTGGRTETIALYAGRMMLTSCYVLIFSGLDVFLLRLQDHYRRKKQEGAAE